MLKYNKNNLPFAKQMRKNLTPWERKLWIFFLKEYPFHFYKQRLIDDFIVDFYCPKAKIAIELDGSQHYDDVKMQEDNVRTQKLNALGIKVLRISNLDVDKRFQSVCEFIDCEIKQRI